MSSVIDDGRHGPYKTKYACFDCRKVFKSRDRNSRLYTCPDCNGTLYAMRENFRAPKQRNKKAWNRVKHNRFHKRTTIGAKLLRKWSNYD